MRRLSITASTLIVLFVFSVMPCFALGEFAVTNGPLPGWGRLAGPVVVTGDFNGDGRTDLAQMFGCSWCLPVAFSNGDGTFNITVKPINSTTRTNNTAAVHYLRRNCRHFQRRRIAKLEGF